MTQAAPDGDRTTLHNAAHAYASNGIAIFPCRPRDKRPLTANGFHDATTDLDQINTWWTATPDANIGVPLGTNGVFAVDVDGPDGAAALTDLEHTYQPLPDTYQVITGRAEGSGRHYIYRQPANSDPIRNRQLADHLETRGDGGYVIAPPSIHPSGRPYLAEGRWASITDPPAWLLALARTDRPTTGDGTVPVFAPATGDTNHAAHKRLTAAAGQVAIAPEGQRNNILNWAAYTIGRIIAAEHLDPQTAGETLLEAATRAGLDHHEAVATIHSGFNAATNDPDPTSTNPTELPPTTLLPKLTTPTDDDHDQPDSTSPNSSWAPVDGTDYIAGTWTPPTPTHLTRSDGLALFYPGRINLLFGESEAGKGWVTLHAIAQALADGHNVLYIDFEDYADTIYARLRLLGSTINQLTNQFAYIRPDNSLDQQGSHALTTTIQQLAPTLVVLDGVTGAMSLHGLDTNSSTDVDQFYSLLGEPLARTNAAVVFIDHVTKSSENRGKGPIGSQHKRARVSGASYEVSSVTPIAPGREGRLRLKIDKDRLGAVRSAHPTRAGDFVLNSTNPDQTIAVLYAPESADEPFRPTQVMEKISRRLQLAAPGGLTAREIDGLGGTKSVLQLARDTLVTEGYIEFEKTTSGAHSYTHKKPFYSVPNDLPETTTVPASRPASRTVPIATGTGVGGKSEPSVPASRRLYKPGTRDADEAHPGNPTLEVPL